MIFFNQYQLFSLKLRFTGYLFYSITFFYWLLFHQYSWGYLSLSQHVLTVMTVIASALKRCFCIAQEKFNTHKGGVAVSSYPLSQNRLERS